MKSIQSANRPYIKPVSAYNHVTANPQLPLNKLSSRSSSKFGSTTNVRASQTMNARLSQLNPDVFKPYGYQLNQQFNSQRPK